MNPDEAEMWGRGLERFRKEKDEYFGLGHDSPIPEHERPGFKGLKYYDPDPDLRFEATLQRYPNPDGIVMTTSKGTRQLFNKVGYFELPLGQGPLRVQAYQSAERDDPHLFIPFRDATSGPETYGAARYLDMRVEHDDEYAVDFNYAYNPYCAYNDGYVCPLPPTENWLKVPVRAGEKKYHE